MGVHPHAPMKGVQSPCPLCVRVPRGVRPDQADRGGASLRAPGPAAERGPDEAQQRACAPRRRARRGEPACALASAVASDEDWTRKKLRALYALCASGGVSVRLAFTSARRYFRGIPPSCQSRRGYRSPGYMLPPDGRGYDKQGGYIKPHIDGTYGSRVPAQLHRDLHIARGGTTNPFWLR